ncbi:MAG: hypothetical protein AAFV33_08620, partial [Chloroflexota bacterium]
AAAAILASGIMTVGAQDSTEDPQPATQTEETGQRGFGLRDGNGPRGDRGPRGNFQRGAFGGGEVRELVEQYTGLSGQELRQALRDDATLASLIEANGESVDAFVDEAVALAEARIDEAVANGRIDQERADMMTESLTETITAAINGEGPLRGRGGPGGRIGGLMNEETAALIESYTGLEPQAVADALRGGDTLASLIEANGGDVDAFVVEMTAIAEARIEERNAARLENLPDAIEAFVNGERPIRDGLRGDANTE